MDLFIKCINKTDLVLWKISFNRESCDCEDPKVYSSKSA